MGIECFEKRLPIVHTNCDYVASNKVYNARTIDVSVAYIYYWQMGSSKWFFVSNRQGIPTHQSNFYSNVICKSSKGLKLDCS